MSPETAIHTIETPRPTYPFIPDYIPSDEPVSVHLIDGDETILFGTGYASGVVTLMRQFERLGEPDIVVVEHADPDHYDAVPILRELYDLTVAIPDDDAAALSDAGIEADLRLHDDDSIGDMRAIHVPGHSPGNMSFLHEPTGTLLAGDTVVHSTSPNAAPGDWHGPLAPMKPLLNDDDELARENIRILTEYDITSVRLTHGPNVDDAPPALETLLEDLERS